MKRIIFIAFVLIILGLIFYFSIEDEEVHYVPPEISHVTGLSDGIYLGQVYYHNPHTGHSNSIKLKVEVQDNKLVKIYWPNGGWLDDSHFSPPRIYNGRAAFYSDKGIEYKIKIIE